MEIVRSKIQGILNKDVIGKRKLKTIDVLMVLKTTDTLSFEYICYAKLDEQSSSCSNV